MIGWSRDEEVAPDLMGGWRQCSADVRYVTLDGEHHLYMSAPQALLDEIARALAPTGSSVPGAPDSG